MLWAESAQRANLLWSDTQRCCCEQLFCNQTSGLIQLESSGLYHRIDPH